MADNIITMPCHPSLGRTSALLAKIKLWVREILIKNNMKLEKKNINGKTISK